MIFDPTVHYYYDSATGQVVATNDPAKYTKLSLLGEQRTGLNHDIWNDPTTLAQQYKQWWDDLPTTSPVVRSVKYNIVQVTDTNRFVKQYVPGQPPVEVPEDGYINNCFIRGLDTTPPCNGWIDFKWLVEDLFDNPAAPDPEANNICRRFNRGDFDELWVFNAPLTGFPESTLAGPGHFNYNDAGYNSWTAPTSCNRLMPIMGFTYDRSLREMLEVFGHRLESSMIKVYGPWNRTTPKTMWDRFAQVDWRATDNASGCGDAHFTPNAIGQEDEYDYNRLYTSNSFCEQFLTNYPNINMTQLQSVNADTWDIAYKGAGCQSDQSWWPCKLDFYSWWYSRVPHFVGASGGVLHDWWEYVIDPNVTAGNLRASSNLAMNKSIVSSVGVTNAEKVNDSVKFTQETYSRLWPATFFNQIGTSNSNVVIDLGATQQIRSATVQADANDTYLVEYATSLSPANWQPLGVVAPAAATGLATRALPDLNAAGRYLRLSATSGSDGIYAISEIEIFDRASTPSMRYVDQGPYNVGTNCANPSENPSPNDWKFRVTGIPTGYQPIQLEDGSDGIWVAPPCDAANWPLVATRDAAPDTQGTYGWTIYVHPWQQVNFAPPANRVYTLVLRDGAGNQITVSESLVNLARNKVITSDSACSSSENASKAVDGSTDTKWCSTGTSKWIQVDLGASYMLRKFAVKHAGVKESPQYNTRDFTIQLSSDGTNWTTAVNVTGNSRDVSLHDSGGATARYVRLNVTASQQSGSGPARIYELEAYGYSNERLDVVVRGSDNNVYHKAYRDGGWPNGVSLGSPPNGATSDPSIVSWGNGRLDVFVRGADNALWQKTYSNGTWSAWSSLGGALTSGPDATSWGNGRIDVAVRGADNHVYLRSFINGSWANWTSVGFPTSSTASDPSIVSWGNGRLDVFVRGADNALWQKTYSNGTWSAWSSLGGALTAGPDATSWGNGRIDVVVRGADNYIYLRSFINGSWANWLSLGAPNGTTANVGPAIVTGSVGSFDVFVRGSDDALWQKSYKNSTWSSWTSLNGQWSSGPDATTWSLR